MFPTQTSKIKKSNKKKNPSHNFGKIDWRNKNDKKMSKSKSQKLLSVFQEFEEEQINQKLNQHLSKISESEEKINSENEDSKNNEKEKNDTKILQKKCAF